MNEAPKRNQLEIEYLGEHLSTWLSAMGFMFNHSVRRPCVAIWLWIALVLCYGMVEEYWIPNILLDLEVMTSQD